VQGRYAGKEPWSQPLSLRRMHARFEDRPSSMEHINLYRLRREPAEGPKPHRAPIPVIYAMANGKIILKE
jgi:hypothetical protein